MIWLKIKENTHAVIWEEANLKITNVRINGIENPVGYTYDYLLCSWNVEEAQGKKQTNAVIEVSTEEDFSDILYKKEAADLKQNGEKLEVNLKPRTTYYYRVTVYKDERSMDRKMDLTGKRR